jgi:hypothetical protein
MKPIYGKRGSLITRQTCISRAISGERFICWFIPDFAASIVDTVKSLMASCTFSSVARWHLVWELINEVHFVKKKVIWTKIRKRHSNYWTQKHKPFYKSNLNLSIIFIVFFTKTSSFYKRDGTFFSCEDWFERVQK